MDLRLPAVLSRIRSPEHQTQASDSPSPALTPPPGNPRFPLSDGVRGLAILGVIACHASASRWHVAWWGPMAERLDVCVLIFFVLSGFLLYRPFVTARAGGHPIPSLRQYARRRVLRIVPAYWVALTVLGLAFALPGVFGSRWWVYYGFLQSFQLHVADGGLGPAWSLSVEASFYLLLPAFAILMRYLGREGGQWIRHELTFLGLASLIAFSLQAGAFGGIVPAMPSSFLFLADVFAAGMALAVASVALEQRQLSLGPSTLAGISLVSWALSAGAFLIGSLVVVLPEPGTRGVSRYQPLEHHLFMVMCAALAVLPAVLDREGRLFPGRLLRVRVLTGLGVISYGLFLWHQPLLNWIAPILGRHHWMVGQVSLTNALAAFVLALPLAVASYYVVELPFLRRKERRPIRSVPVSRGPIALGEAPPG